MGADEDRLQRFLPVFSDKRNDERWGNGFNFNLKFVSMRNVCMLLMSMLIVYW